MMTLDEKIALKAKLIADMTAKGLVDRSEWRWKHDRELYKLEMEQLRIKHGPSKSNAMADGITPTRLVSHERFFKPSDGVTNYIRVTIPHHAMRNSYKTFFKNSKKIYRISL